MPSLDRRTLLQAGIALAVPFGSVSLLSGFTRPSDNLDNNDLTNTDEDKTMQIKYLEIVTTDVDALCKQYSTNHGVTFAEPDATLGTARVAKLKGGGMIGIRGPLRDTETPVIRPYILVEDLEKAVGEAKEAGAEVAIASMQVPGHGTIGIVIQGGIECGLWQDPK